MKPIYAENIMVMIKYNQSMDWYILDKDYCYLDYFKLEEAYRCKGYEVVTDDSLRFGIKTVNELTCCSFLDQIRQYKITADELKNMLINEADYDEKLAYNPSLYIDFDNKILISHYAEPESFEDFVPDGWEGKYQDFESIIPQDQRYWTDENGKSLITGT